MLVARREVERLRVLHTDDVELTTQLAAVKAELSEARGELVEVRKELIDRLASLRYLRRNIDGYDGTFEAAGWDEDADTWNAVASYRPAPTENGDKP